MSDAVQFRRGTTQQHQSFTGILGEITVDTDKKTVVVHDGSTQGGSPLVTGSDLNVFRGQLSQALISLFTTGCGLFPVTAYGAFGNGSHDDTAGIQAAIDAAAAVKGGRVLFPATPNSYTISDVLHAHSGVSLVGASRDTVVLKQTSTSKGHIYGEDVNFFSISGMTLEGMGMDSSGGGGIFLNRVNNDNTQGLHFSDLTVKNCAGSGIVISCPIVSKFENVTCLALSGDGFSFYGGGTSITMDSCYAITCTKAGYALGQMNYSVLNACVEEVCGIGFRLENCNNVQLNACGCEDTIYRSNDYEGDGYVIIGGVGNTLTSCYSRNDTAVGIKLSGGRTTINGYRQLKGDFDPYAILGTDDVFAILSNLSVDGEIGLSPKTYINIDMLPRQDRISGAMPS